MLLEAPLAMVAWMGVVLIQAIFHFGMFGNARRDQSHEAEVDSFRLDEDKDPPEGLETLLSQTGEDVISVSAPHRRRSFYSQNRCITEQIAK